ncbi:uncharacterized protein [Parasteatoda tepidariorum]|uniref:uncharacterized protein n=1 Tax=Parasteatoda tepidariorum TaxID=114398 RepID=UPI0039BC22DC
MSFQKFSSKLLQNSMITGIPKIVSANSLHVKVLRTLFFFVCIVGFVVQTWQFMQLYGRYETVVKVTVKNTDEFELPSFTVCNDYGFNSSSICDDARFIERCHLLSEVKEYRNLCECFSRRYCRDGELTDNRAYPSKSVYEELYSMGFKNFTPFLQEKSHFFYTCNLELPFIDFFEEERCRNCFTRSMFIPKTESPIVSSCFTFNSMIGKPDNSSETAYGGASFVFSLDLDPRGYPPFIYQSKAQISFHHSRQIVDPYEQGFSMEIGKHYSFHLKKIEKNLLPYPYDTNCIDYLEKWKARGGYGPTNKRECIQECYKNITMTARGVQQNEKGRNRKKTIAPEKAKEISECQIQNCRPACFDVFYEVSRDASETIEGKCRADLDKRLELINVNIDMSNLEITTYNCSPKIESIELFGNIGGYVGMWLGISLVAVFDFLSTAFDLLKFPFRNFTIKKTRVHRINHQKRKKNVNKKKHKFCSNYLTNVFRDSMLSGVPQILLAESIVKKCVLTLVFLSCIVGYLYQSSEFLRLYWKYETVVDIRLTNSNLTELPSFTFCNYDGNNALNLENRIKWVKEFGELTNKKWNSRTSKPRGERFVLPFFGYADIARFLPDERLEYVQDLNKVLSSCSFVERGKHPEDCDLSYFKKSSVPTENFYGFLSGCYTFNTVFGRPNAKPSVVTSSGTIVLNISIDESEYIYLYHPPEGLISFHNPYHIVNPHMKGFSLSMKAQRHTFHLKKVVKKLLPYPYDTNCIDYLSRWKERGGKGPIDNEDCYNECQLNTSLKIYGCLNSALRPYSMESNTCAMDSFMISDNGTFEAFDGPEFKLKLDECVKKNCGPACYEESYQVIEDLEDVQNEASLGFHIKILFNIKNNC